MNTYTIPRPASWRTTICGLIALLGASMSHFHQYPLAAQIGMEMMTFATGLGLLFASDSKSNLPTNTRNGTGRVLVWIVAFAILSLSFLGCALTPDQAARVARGSKTAAYVATSEYLLAKPQSRPAFEIALADLRTLETADTITMEEILEIVNRLPVKELKSPHVRIIVTGATMVLEDVTGPIAIDLGNLRQIVTGLRQGVERGLNESAP